MNIEKILDETIIHVTTLARETYAQLERSDGDEASEHLATIPEQPGQRNEDGTLRKVARAHLPGTGCFVDVREEEDGWAVVILDKEGAVMYRCDPGKFNLKLAAAVIPEIPGPE